MLSQTTKKAIVNLTNQQSKKISITGALYDLLNRNDPSSAHYQASTFNPALPLQGQQSKVVRETGDRSYQTTTLKNGIRVVTESQGLPNVVDLGILVDVGTRDETNESSGSLQSIQNTYLKTVFNTNETVNYGLVQMSGGNFEMEYDQETSYFKANCLQHDVVDIFNMVSDCAIEPRSVVAASVGQEKNKGTHSLNSQLGEEFNQNVFKVAYGTSGLGMPLSGHKGNIGNLNAYTLQKFQLENITPNRIIVSGAGVENHDEFVELVNAKLSYMPAVDGKTSQRVKSQYRGGEVRVLTEANNVNLALVFEGAAFNTADVYALRVAQQLLEQSRIRSQLLNKLSYVDSAVALNSNFSDSGLFGLRLSGASSNVNDLVSNGAATLKSLTGPITADELNFAKSALKINVLTALERQSDRLEEATKNLKYHGKVVLQDYVAQIDKVSAEQVQKAVAQVLKSNLTLVAQGGSVNQLASYDKILSSLRV